LVDEGGEQVERAHMVLPTLDGELVGFPDGFFCFGGEIFERGHRV
jgi:hypothetical protein